MPHRRSEMLVVGITLLSYALILIAWLMTNANLADDLLRVDLQGYEAVCDVNLSPGYAIHDPRNLGFDFAAIIQPGDHG